MIIQLMATGDKVLPNLAITIVGLLLLSCVLSSISLFWPKTVHQRMELEPLELGVPISFVTQDQSWLPIGVPDGPSFPAQSALLSPWEYPLHVIWWRFLLNVMVIFVALGIVCILLKALWHRLRGALL